MCVWRSFLFFFVVLLLIEVIVIVSILLPFLCFVMLLLFSFYVTTTTTHSQFWLIRHTRKIIIFLLVLFSFAIHLRFLFPPFFGKTHVGVSIYKCVVRCCLLHFCRLIASLLKKLLFILLLWCHTIVPVGLVLLLRITGMTTKKMRNNFHQIHVLILSFFASSFTLHNNVVFHFKIMWNVR